MIDNLFFIYCTILSFSGFTIGFYGIMVRHKIDLETRIGMNKGFDFDTEEGRTYFALKYQNWKTGSYFNSQVASLIGILITLTGAGLNLINNSRWTSILVIIIAFIVFVTALNILKWRIHDKYQYIVYI